MKLISKFWFVMLFLVWAPWIYHILTLDTSKIDESLIWTQAGTVISAQCYRSRSNKGVDFKVRYDGSVSVKKEHVILRITYQCDQGFLDSVIAKRAEITRYKNYYLSVVFDGNVILALDDGIDYANDKFSTIYYPLAVTIIAFLAILAKFYHSNKRGRRHCCSTN